MHLNVWACYNTMDGSVSTLGITRKENVNKKKRNNSKLKKKEVAQIDRRPPCSPLFLFFPLGNGNYWRYLASVEYAKDAGPFLEFHGGQRAAFRLGLEDTARGREANSGMKGPTAHAATAIAGRVRADAAAPHIAQVFKRDVFRWRETRLVPFNYQPRVLQSKVIVCFWVWGNKEVTFSGSTLSAARIIPSRHLLMMGKTLRSISTPLRIKFSICLILLSSNSWRVWKTPGSAVCVREEKKKHKNYIWFEINSWSIKLGEPP